MTITTETITTTITYYVASDGTKFTTERKCRHHEWTLSATKVYLVSLRGARTDAAEVYSTYELALKATGGSNQWVITEVCVDLRFWETLPQEATKTIEERT